MLRTFVYIDGFNLYYRALKNTPYKWLDIVEMCGKMLGPQNRLHKVKYFTARVKPEAKDPDKANRQDAYIRALRTRPEVEISYGRFESHEVMARLAQPLNGQHFAKIIKTEEKGSDVNLAVHLLNDAWADRYDCAVVLSNDSDLAESMKLMKEHFPKKVLGIFTPGNNQTSGHLKQYADFIKPVRTGILKISQFPAQIAGTAITKPAQW